jgi:hypothetical protein
MIPPLAQVESIEMSGSTFWDLLESHQPYLIDNTTKVDGATTSQDCKEFDFRRDEYLMLLGWSDILLGVYG